MYGAGGQKRVPDSFVRDFASFLPPISEQSAIATFLNRETAKIDALIAEQQHLIELLQEKRQAVISHAVTKGLNPDAPMKDSGVEWLGEVPEHWEVGQLRRFTKTVKTGRTPDESDFIEHDDFIPWFTPSSFNDATLTLEATKHVSIESVNEGRANIFSKDAVLVVGIGATLGKVGIPGDECSGNQQINAIESSGKLIPRFLGLFLSAAQEQMRISSNASTLGIMNQQKTKELVINCPPLVEQEQIIFHTEKALRGMLEMSEQCHRVVELLQERRSALISAAVTGQIDVRGLVPEVSAA
jgi:type I restriction enzyme S subunit